MRNPMEVFKKTNIRVHNEKRGAEAMMKVLEKEPNLIEINAFISFKHPNLVKGINIIRFQSRYYIEYELVEFFPDVKSLFYLAHLLSALLYLQEHGFVHKVFTIWDIFLHNNILLVGGYSNLTMGPWDWNIYREVIDYVVGAPTPDPLTLFLDYFSHPLYGTYDQSTPGGNNYCKLEKRMEQWLQKSNVRMETYFAFIDIYYRFYLVDPRRKYARTCFIMACQIHEPELNLRANPDKEATVIMTLRGHLLFTNFYFYATSAESLAHALAVSTDSREYLSIDPCRYMYNLQRNHAVGNKNVRWNEIFSLV